MKDFNPSIHKEGVVLYERRSVRNGGIIDTTIVESDTPYEEAVLTPWYYMVDDDDVQRNKTLVRIKGGDGSGHYGHAGRPGRVGGSVPASVAMSLRTGATAAERQAAASARGKAIREVAKKHGLDTKPKTVKWNTPDPDRVKNAVPEEWRHDPEHHLAYFMPEGFPEGVTPSQFLYTAFDNEFPITYTDSDGVVRSETWKTVIVSMEKYPYGLHTPGSNLTDAISVKGYVYDEEGGFVGNFNRTLGKSGHVYHSYFSISSEKHGTGFGTAFYRQSEESYAAAGYNMITLSANIDVGGYAWARMGFDFRYDSDRHTMGVGLAHDYVKVKYGSTYNVSTLEYTNIEKRFKEMKAWEMAAVVVGDNKVGKRYMLGSGWSGIKYLDENSEHRQVGMAYYEAKEKQKKVKK